jgi:hypothetical protein
VRWSAASLQIFCTLLRQPPSQRRCYPGLPSHDHRWESSYVKYKRLISIMEAAKLAAARQASDNNSLPAGARSPTSRSGSSPVRSPSSKSLHLTLSLAGAGRAPDNPVDTVVRALEEVRDLLACHWYLPIFGGAADALGSVRCARLQFLKKLAARRCREHARLCLPCPSGNRYGK